MIFRHILKLFPLCIIREKGCYFTKAKKEDAMRELSVYYCPKCGHYGYYQLPRNAVCPKCNVDMVLLSITYQDFMDLTCEERDDFLAGQIIESSSPYVRRLVAPHKACNNREIIARMSDHIRELESENKKLNETVEWMHQTIWDLVRKNRGIPSNGDDETMTTVKNSTDEETDGRKEFGKNGERRTG